LQPFRNFAAWQKSHALTLRVYRITESFPSNEADGLAAALRRGATHFSMKLAEACGHDSTREFVHSLRQARSIAVEVEYHLLLSRDLHLMKIEDYQALLADLVEIRKIIVGLMRTTAV
jgi:four helix bundle protein